MTAKAALAKHLLEGKVLTVMNCFQLIGLTNAAREVSRMIEKPFGVQVSRVRKEGTSRYGQPIFWYEYRLNRAEHNKEGIEKMKEYVRQNQPTSNEAKTEKQRKEFREQDLFLGQ